MTTTRSSTAAVLSHRVMAPSTLGTFLRAFTFGHVRQLDRVAETLRRRLLTLPGRLTRSARRWRLHLPTGWPWASELAHAITRLRALPAAT
jgi:Transposase DDE domain group 1